MATYQSARNVAQQSTPSAQSENSGGLPIVNIPVVFLNGTIYPVIMTNMMSGVLPVGKGGTGLSELDGGKLLASNGKGQSLEEIDVDVQYLSGLKANIQDQIDKTRRYILNIPTTGWTKSDTGYTQTFSVAGMKSEDNPIIGLIPSATTVADIKAEKLAYECIDAATTADGKITVQCYTSAPTRNFSISINCTGK